MKNLIITIATLISLSATAQQFEVSKLKLPEATKTQIRVDYDKNTGVIKKIGDSIKYKVIQFAPQDGTMIINLENYVGFEGEAKGPHKLQNNIRIRPMNEAFFDKGIILEYWVNIETNKTVVIATNINNGSVLK